MKVRLTHVAICVVFCTGVFALFFIGSAQREAVPADDRDDKPFAPLVVTRNPETVTKAKELPSSLTNIQPLMRNVKEEIDVLEKSIKGLNDNLDQLLRKAQLMEAQGEAIAQGIRPEGMSVDEFEALQRFLAPTVVKQDDTLDVIKAENWAIYQNAKAIEDKNYEAIKTLNSAKAHYRQHTFLHYLFEPVWNCPTKEKVPFVADDGAKYVCNTARLAKLGDECIIYSIGVNNKAESMFDFDLATRFPNCKFFLFDPSLDNARHNELTRDLLPNMEFHAWGIAPGISTFNNGRLLLPIDEIKSRLGHTGKRISILKIDTEGAEWLTLPAFMKSPEAQLVDEMQIEVHFFTTVFDTIIPFFESIRNKGFVIFSKDMNGYCGNACMEYAWVNLSLVE